jgi:hypothetical protein
MQTVSLPAPGERTLLTDAASRVRLDEQLDFTLEVTTPAALWGRLKKLLR